MRTIASAIAGLSAAGALALAALGAVPAALALAGWALVLCLALVIERWRYRGLAGARPGPGWEETGERFLDPETGRLVTVWFHPATGERRYVAG
jgi:hypothetical protein